MNYRKPPVSSSVGIEIKAPKGVVLEGDTVVRELIDGQLHGAYSVFIALREGQGETLEFETLEDASAFCKDIVANGYLYEDPVVPDEWIYMRPKDVPFLRIKKVK